MKTIRLMERLQACLNLAGDAGATDAERQAATLAAQRIMAEHNLKADQGKSKERKIITIVTDCFTTKRIPAYAPKLAAIIAEAFRCRTYNKYDKVNRRHTPAFMGYTEDAQAANSIFEFLFKNLQANARKVSNAPNAKSGDWQSYVEGFLVGLLSAFETQSMELMVVIPKEVNDNYDEFSKGLSKGRGGSLRVQLNGEYYTKGKEDGKNAVAKRTLEGGQ